VVIASGGDDKGCYEHLAVSGTSHVQLGRDASADGCRSEITVQARDYGMVLDTQPTWVTGVHQAQLLARVKVNLNLRVPSGIAGVAAAAQTQVDLADTLLNHNRAGIALSLTGSAPQSYSTAEAAVIGTGCSAVEGLIKSDPVKGLYDPASINVYYVDVISASNNSRPEGFDCFEWGAANIIYMSNESVDNMLAHELGHAFGLQYGNGHVNNLKSFTDTKLTNLMNAWPTAPADHWTAGQVYRMNADTRSVLNQLVGVGEGAKAFREGVKRVCQDKAETPVPCPPLAFEGP